MKQAFLICLLFLASACKAQEEGALSFVEKMVQTLQERDSEKLTSLFHAEQVFYLVYPMGANDYWASGLKGICLTTQCLKDHPDRLPRSISESLLEFDFSDLDTLAVSFDNHLHFECETILKPGIYIADKNEGRVLSDAMQHLITYELSGDRKAEVERELVRAQDWEKHSRRVVVATSNQVLIFYITHFKNQWYFGLLDFATVDCSV